MSWFAVGAAAVTVIGSVAGQSSANKKLKKQAMQENLLRSDLNLKNTIRASYRKGLLELQEGLYRKTTAQQSFDTGAQRDTALAQANANAAAAGAVGASVDAVTNDISMQVGSLFAKREEEFDLALFNFDVQGKEIEYDIERQTQGMVTADVASSSEIWTNALLAGGANYIGNRANSSMRLGAGTEGAAPAGGKVTAGGQGFAWD